METRTMKVIAHIRTDFPTKFGIPRQSGLAKELEGLIVFEKEFSNPDALRGVEGYSHLWLLWEFSQAVRETWSPTVRPPRLGGNTRVGVFASRSPFRPNPIGLSVVRLSGVVETPHGLALRVLGADLMDGTPIFDIKPYLPHIEAISDARGGYSAQHQLDHVEVVFPEQWLQMIPKNKQSALLDVLSQDPRPSYQNDPTRVYGFNFMNFDVRFTVQDGVLSVCEIVRLA